MRSCDRYDGQGSFETAGATERERRKRRRKEKRKKKDRSVCCLDFSVFRGIKCNYRGKKVRNMRDKWLPSGRQNSGNGLKVVCASPDGWKSGSSRVGRLSRNLEHTSRTWIRSIDAERYSADRLSQPFSLSSMLLNSRPRTNESRAQRDRSRRYDLNTRFPVVLDAVFINR